MPGERGHYKKAPRGPPTLWVVACGGLTVSIPPTSTEGPELCHSTALSCHLHFSHRSSRNQEAKPEV